MSDLGYLAWHLPKLIGVLTSKQKPKHLTEKIFVVTDAVNGCIYCSWMDSKLAIKSGISSEEVANMMKLQFHTDASEYELNALLFAQHYAETNGTPDPEMTNRLYKFYREKTANDIILAARAVTFGNLYFNTWRAVISSMKGNPAENSNVLFEIVYFLTNAPIILPFIVARKLYNMRIGLE